MNIKWIQYLTKRNSKRKEKKLVREQYQLVKYQIKKAMKAGDFYIYYYGYLLSDVVNKLRQKGFVVKGEQEKYCTGWNISWEI